MTRSILSPLHLNLSSPRPIPLRRVMSLSVENRDLFDAMKGGEVVVGLLRDHEGDTALQVAVVALAETAALREEKNKESLYNADFGAVALKLLREAVTRDGVKPSSSSSAADGSANTAPQEDGDTLDLQLVSPSPGLPLS